VGRRRPYEDVAVLLLDAAQLVDEPEVDEVDLLRA
jgi:hypothetical protein